MNLKEIKEVITLMNENGLTEIEIERDGLKVKLKKGPGEGSVVMSGQPVHYTLDAIPSTKVAAAAAPAEAAKKENTIQIKSPMVGTFYRAPAPDAPPFVDVGQVVEIGQVVCIVEAMKLMNEIKSEVRGKIVEAAVQNAEPVEFGQTLFAVEPL